MFSKETSVVNNHNFLRLRLRLSTILLIMSLNTKVNNDLYNSSLCNNVSDSLMQSLVLRQVRTLYIMVLIYFRLQTFTTIL